MSNSESFDESKDPLTRSSGKIGGDVSTACFALAQHDELKVKVRHPEQRRGIPKREAVRLSFLSSPLFSLFVVKYAVI